MTTLDDLIVRANNDLAALEGLIAGDAAETPIPDASVAYALPVVAYDSGNTAWTLAQNTPDVTDGLYKGLFTLVLETGCSYLTIVSHNVVTPDDGVPARYLACGAGSLTNVATMTALNSQQIMKLEIRSKQPFSVSIKLTTDWCHKFDFTVSNQGFTVFNRMGCNRAVYSAQGWGPNSCANGIIQLNKSLPMDIILTGIEFQLSTNGPNPGDLGYQLHVPDVNAANLLKIEYVDYDKTYHQFAGFQVSASTMWISIDSVNDAHAVNLAYSGKLQWIKIHGKGNNPFGAGNC